MRGAAWGAMFAAVALGIACGNAMAQQYPEKPIRFIVPYPAGGGSDAIARMVTDQLGERLGQPVIVHNVAGAGGVVGTEAAARAEPDGYTLLMGTTGTMVMGPHLGPLRYDTQKSFVAVGRITNGGLVIVANPQAGITDVDDLRKQAAATAGGVSYATGGAGTGGHVIGESIKHLTGMPLEHIGYQGTAAATTDVVGGHVPVLIGDPQVTLPHIRSGRLQAVAVVGSSRAECLPDVPTLVEQGVPLDLAYWWGVMAPAGTPEAIVERINVALNEVLDMPETKAKLQGYCQGSGAGSVQQFAQIVRDDYAEWGRLIRETGIRAN